MGSAAYIARGRAIMSTGAIMSTRRLRLSGFPGWLAWLFIHIAFLTGYRNRIGAIATWCLAFTRDVRRERAFTTREVGHMQDVYQTPASRPGALPAGCEPSTRGCHGTPAPPPAVC
jgi:NADH dehydrogenase